MKGMLRAAIGLAAVLVVGACAPTAGTERGTCYPNDTCNVGLSCLSRLCVVSPTVATRCDGSTESPPRPMADTVPMPPLLAVEADPRAPPLPHRLSVPAPEVSVSALADPNDETPPAEHRRVVLRVWPPSVNVVVDAQTIEVTQPLELAVGAHRLTVHDPCCELYGGTFAVPAAEEAGQIHVVAVKLTLRPAEVKLSGAPRESVVVCDSGILILPDATTEVSMNDLVEPVRCRFYPNDVQHAFTLRAGSRTVIPWPN